MQPPLRQPTASIARQFEAQCVPGAKLAQGQRKSYKVGGLYAKVHSDANKGGEIRRQ